MKKFYSADGGVPEKPETPVVDQKQTDAKETLRTDMDRLIYAAGQGNANAAAGDVQGAGIEHFLMI